MFKRSIRKSIFFGILTLVFTSCGQIQAGESIESDKIEKANKIDELISDYADYGKFNRTVLVTEEGKMIYKKGFGLANMEWDIPNQPDTKFRIASITKQFTAMLIVQLVAENKLDLHVPISTHLPDYPKKNADRITIHHLLTHTSGTPEFDLFLDYREIERERNSPEELVSLFAEQPLQFTPGSKFPYTSTGYVILGVIIEEMTGNSYEEVVQDKIFTPLEMLNSGDDHHSTILKNRASGYANGYVRGEYFNTNYIDMSIPYAAGSIYSTVEDLYLWDQALYTEKLLPKKFRELLFGEYISAFNGRHYGYGWVIGGMQVGNTDERVQTIGHSGGMNGFRTLIIRIPSRKSSIILLNNTERAALFEMTNAIIGILHDKPYDPKKSVAYSLVNVVENRGVEAGFDYYNEIKNLSDFYLNVDEMNITGYELWHTEKVEEATFVFKLNVDAFPDSFIPYDSYGEILLSLGDTTEAIKNYKKSVELNPNNRGAVNILKGLGTNMD